MSDLQAVPTVFLPPPRLPALRRDVDAATVAAVAGDDLAAPLLAVEQAHEVARAALADLTSCRPGSTADGASWRAALDADFADYVDSVESGATPKTWRTERLLREDPHRWATASAACRSFPHIRDQYLQRLDRDAVEQAASLVGATQSVAWAKAAADGWSSRADHAVAWQHRRVGEQALGLYRQAVRVQAWAAGRPLPAIDRNAVPPIVDDLPVDPDARGHWLALGLVLSPLEVWLRLPDPLTVRMPDGSDELVQRAVPGSPQRFRALRNDGVHAIER